MPDLMGLGLVRGILRPSGAEFYRRTPFRNWDLITDAFLSTLAVVICIAITVRFWAHMTVMPLLWFGIMWAWIIKLWNQVIRGYWLLHSFSQRGDLAEIPAGSSLEATLSVAASLTHASLFTLSLVMNVLLILFAAALTGKI